ncbi:MAG TPA: hypothetical protein VNH18_33120, partial [Bryobacteraceae bacterium]|nr:hypothetical protein [Bryobacteraceae bacterium]
TFTVTSSSASGVTNTLTWQNVRVRPTAGTPLALGNLTRSGTASVVGLSTNANLGSLREVAGSASVLAIQTQPSAAATVGEVFAQQPIIQVRDQFGNVRNLANGNADNTTLVSAARAAGSGTLQGTTSLNALNGVVAYTNLSLNVATNITISFSSSGLIGVTSSTITVSPAAASPMVVSIQPDNATADPGNQQVLPTLSASEGTLVMTGIRSVPNGIKINFSGGSAGRTYQVERTSTLQANGTIWETVGTATTDSIGQGEFIDTTRPGGQSYYRAVSQ